MREYSPNLEPNIEPEESPREKFKKDVLRLLDREGFELIKGGLIFRVHSSSFCVPLSSP